MAERFIIVSLVCDGTTKIWLKCYTCREPVVKISEAIPHKTIVPGSLYNNFMVMENRGLLFIPDISGFTRFVNETEIEHSRVIIQELLEILINSNQSGLEVSEIEGDAILFYKFGTPPSLETLYQQVEKMFCEFHRSLILYDHTKYCQCKACVSVVDLSLKVITHYGEFTGYTVQNFKKLIGKDVIVAHQLLKNDIDQHEYWLVTDGLLKGEAPVNIEGTLSWNTSFKQTEQGAIPFSYAQLTHLKKALPAEVVFGKGIDKKTKMISVSGEYDTDIITLFHATGDFNFRSRWMEGVKKVEEIDHYLPRVGMRCRCTLDSGEVVIYSTSYAYTDDKIEFSETDEQQTNTTYFTLEKMDGKKVKLTLDYYLQENKLAAWYFNLFKKKKMQAALQRSLANLQEAIKEIHLPG